MAKNQKYEVKGIVLVPTYAYITVIAASEEAALKKAENEFSARSAFITDHDNSAAFDFSAHTATAVKSANDIAQRTAQNTETTN